MYNSLLVIHASIWNVICFISYVMTLFDGLDIYMKTFRVWNYGISENVWENINKIETGATASQMVLVCGWAESRGHVKGYAQPQP